LQAGGHRFDPDRLHQAAAERISHANPRLAAKPASAAKRAIRRSFAATDGVRWDRRNHYSRDEDMRFADRAFAWPAVHEGFALSLTL
jgi:hypothetical protein